MELFSKRLPNENDIISGLLSNAKERRISERQLYENFFYLISHGAKKYKISSEEASSVYSDTIISAIENIISNKFEKRSSLKTFIYQIFKNKSVDLIRKKTTNKSAVNNNNIEIDSIAMMLSDKTQTIIESMIKKGDQEFLMEKLKEIGEKCRKILMLFEDGYADKDIALEMSYNSAEVVKTSRMRCIEKLRGKVILKKI